MVIPDAPVRALVIFGDGLMQSLSPPPKYLHLHSLAASGACGFLALRDIPLEVNTTKRDLFELLQILDVHTNLPEDPDDVLSYVLSHRQCPISERFMGMRAAMITNSKSVANLGKHLGLSLLDKDINVLNEGLDPAPGLDSLPNPSATATGLVHILGLDVAKASDSFQLILLHVGSGPNNDKNNVYLDWINALVGEVKGLMQPGTEANNHLYLALILGYGDAAILGDNVSTNGIPTLEQYDSFPAKLRNLCPCQTYKMKDGEVVNNVRDHHPLIVVHYAEGVTRRDQATCFSFDEIKKNGVNLTMLADKFLHEIAFKLWKAPKYGA